MTWWILHGGSKFALTFVHSICRGGGQDGSPHDAASSGESGAPRDSSVVDPPENEATGGEAASDGAPTLVEAHEPDGGFAGCAEITVPLASAGETTDFTINLGGNYDFTTATISVTLQAPNARAGFVEAYIQDNGNGYSRLQLGPEPLSGLGS